MLVPIFLNKTPEQLFREIKECIEDANSRTGEKMKTLKGLYEDFICHSTLHAAQQRPGERVLCPVCRQDFGKVLVSEPV